MRDMERRLREVAEADVTGLLEAEKSYGSSWRKRGGVGAFMMLARKWDRLETALHGMPCAPWDIFRAYEIDQREEGIIDDIRDLRRYLMLVEEFVTRPKKTEDTGEETNRPATGSHLMRDYGDD